MQIHIYVSPTFWQGLFDATDLWPAERRTQVHICRYAMTELAAEIQQGYPLPEGSSTPVPEGTVHIQCRTSTPDEEGDWEFLREKYGSGAAALRVALQFFYDSIMEEEEEEEVIDESPWAEFNRLGEDELMVQSTATLRSYATALGVSSASKIPGGKGVLVSRILEARKVQPGG